MDIEDQYLYAELIPSILLIVASLLGIDVEHLQSLAPALAGAVSCLERRIIMEARAQYFTLRRLSQPWYYDLSLRLPWIKIK